MPGERTKVQYYIFEVYYCREGRIFPGVDPFCPLHNYNQYQKCAVTSSKGCGGLVDSNEVRASTLDFREILRIGARLTLISPLEYILNLGKGQKSLTIVLLLQGRTNLSWTLLVHCITITNIRNVQGPIPKPAGPRSSLGYQERKSRR